MKDTRHSTSKLDDKAYVRSLLHKHSARYEPLMETRHEYYRLREAYMSLKDDNIVDKERFIQKSESVPDADLVGRIVNAMKSTRNATDAYKPGGYGQRAEMSPATAFILGLSDLEIQLGAWEVLLRICDAWKGILNVPWWSRWKIETEAGRHSFDRHFGFTLSVLRRSKFACHRVFEAQATWLSRLALRPMADLKRINRNIAKGVGPKPAMEQHSYMDWHKTMGVRFNSSTRRSWRLDSEAIREALPEIFEKTSRSAKRRLGQEDTARASEAAKRPRASNAHRPTKQVLFHNENGAVENTQRIQPVTGYGARSAHGVPTSYAFSTQPMHVSPRNNARSTNNNYPSASLTAYPSTIINPQGLNQNNRYHLRALRPAQTGGAEPLVNANGVESMNPDLQVSKHSHASRAQNGRVQV